MMLSTALLIVLSIKGIFADIRPTRLLPTDGSILHCAGQTNQNLSDFDASAIGSFENYTNYLRQGTKPSIFMVYVALIFPPQQLLAWFEQLSIILDGLNNSSDTWYGVQIGLWFYTQDNIQYDCEIANGSYDTSIQAMIQGIEKMGRPIWLRIGYEFNGGWAGFDFTCYINAYRRITTMLRNNTFTNKYVANVWDYTADANVNGYMNYYPGDDYVDWWAANVFGVFPQSNAGIGSPYINGFIDNAASRGFPVMLGETTPRQVPSGGYPNGCAYSGSWDIWYKPYFEMINNASNNIKAFCYINWNWWEYGFNWGQCDISSPACSSVGPNYQSAISDGNYFNAQSEAATKAGLGLP